MGNLLSCQAPEVAGGMVVLSDGTVHELDQQTSVAELMLEHPRQFVVEAKSLSSSSGSSKVTPLPADHMLDPRKVYVMLPMTRGKGAALLAEEARRILIITRSALKSRYSASIFGRRGVTEKEKVMEVDKRRDGLMMKEGEKVGEEVEWRLPATVLEERPEILMRQYSSKGWKPSLRTIEERSLQERKVPHWLF